MKCRHARSDRIALPVRALDRSSERRRRSPGNSPQMDRVEADEHSRFALHRPRNARKSIPCCWHFLYKWLRSSPNALAVSAIPN